MAIRKSQMRKQVEGQLRGARDEKRKIKTYAGGGMKNRKIKKVIKGLTKASKTHASQAKTLKGVLNGYKKRNGKKA